jgi:hypothetical protein
MRYNGGVHNLDCGGVHNLDCGGCHSLMWISHNILCILNVNFPH